MLAAYLEYHSRTERTGLKVCDFQDLYMVVHQPNGALAPSLRLPSGTVSLPTRPCLAPRCRRCQENMGGYMFRWYHPAWEDVYLRHKRDGAWSPH